MNLTLVFFLSMFGAYMTIETLSIYLMDMSSGLLLPFVAASLIGYLLIRRKEKHAKKEIPN